MKVTEAKVAVLARVMFGSKAILRQNRKALTKEDREASLAERRRCTDRIKVIDERIKFLRWTPAPLIEAVENYLSDATNIDVQPMKDALAIAKEVRDLTKERADLRRKQDGLFVTTRRWDIYTVGGGGGIQFAHIQMEADTLDELHAALTKMIDAKLVKA